MSTIYILTILLYILLVLFKVYKAKQLFSYVIQNVLGANLTLITHSCLKAQIVLPD